ncbi:FecR family protein [Shewanella psychrophila]|uniref:FecR family protein n=1 Tax=Shewanella psychrophila TaxID=225848 RepID=A0A1S6HX16_9GAMM|nr:FecR domain-containing protein [Shewanella psychrophila]AQS40110.1 FecR family protein [Shewanella psychrophila]
MSTVKKFYTKEDIQDQASRWVSRIDRGLSEAEIEALSKWISESNAHREALFYMASYWDDLSVLNELSMLFPLKKSVSNGKAKWQYLAVAASFLLLFLFGGRWVLNTQFIQWESGDKQEYVQKFVTSIGKQTTFSLPDGSTVQLNTNSAIKVNYSSSYRQLTLIRGEAKFDVAKDRSRPFTVTVGEQSFTALGTIFNVQKNNDLDMELVVSHGRVLVTIAGQSIEKITESIKDTSKQALAGLLVSTGEKVVIIENTCKEVEKLPLEQLQRDLAWQQGMLIFEGEPLSTALTEVSRYSSIKFDIVDPALSELKVAGYFKAGDIDGLLASLQSNFSIVYSKGADNIIHLTSANAKTPILENK